MSEVYLPIVDTRDEPHADPERFRRVHVTISDANMSEVCTFLKVGSCALVLSMSKTRFCRIHERWPSRSRRYTI